MKGCRVVVSVARSKVHHHSRQHLPALGLLLPGRTHEVTATRTSLLTPKSAVSGVPGMSQRECAVEVDRSCGTSSQRAKHHTCVE
jgi:hypothetical protein